MLASDIIGHVTCGIITHAFDLLLSDTLIPAHSIANAIVRHSNASLRQTVQAVAYCPPS